MRELKVLELFGGISAPHKALTNLGFNVKTVDYVEFDSKVVSMRNAIYDTEFKPKSVVGYHCDEEVDLLIGGSPCQSFSLAGNQEGGDIESGTRSSLMWEQLRLIKETMPKVTIWENVKNVLSHKHKHNFDMYQNELEDLGYTNYYKVLNSADFGIPQERERVFLVSIRNDVDIDFNFENLIKVPTRPIKEFLDFDTMRILTKDDIVRIHNWTAFERPLKKIMTLDSNCKTITTRSIWNTSSMKLIKKDRKLYCLGQKEMLLLMGFSEEDFNKALNGGTIHTVAHVAGNSIVVDVLEAIFKELFK